MSRTEVLVAGPGGASIVAELLIRRGFASLVIACGGDETDVLRERLRDIDPDARVEVVPEGITRSNVVDLVDRCDYAIDLLGFDTMSLRVALHGSARSLGKVVLTAASVDGAGLHVFTPDSVTFEELFDYEPGSEWTGPQDAVGVDRAAVLIVAALENLALYDNANFEPACPE